MIDKEGYRPNVGIILCNAKGKVFWARRCGEDAWQFPQGGIQRKESPEEALFRELNEEIGLNSDDVEIIGQTAGWLRYQIPKRFLRQQRHRKHQCIGQKQRWFLLRLVGSEQNVCLDNSAQPEFDSWCWVDHWQTVEQVIPFKRRVYRQALEQLMPLLEPVASSRTA